MQHIEIYEKALKKWGGQAQYEQMVEECAELIVILKHFFRGKADVEDVIDELADVSLMVGQLTYMLGEDRLQRAVLRKISKLEVILGAED